MSAVAAVVASAVLGAIAVVQIVAAAGAPVGRVLWGGGHRVLPVQLRVASAVSVLLYAAMAALLWARAGLLGADAPGFVPVATWVLFGYFALGVVMNALSRSALERAVMTPACLVLAASSLLVALGV